MDSVSFWDLTVTNPVLRLLAMPARTKAEPLNVMLVGP